ncbi:MAG: energy transducer TonB [Candidatus Eisenbacteria bacterium]
MTTRAALFLLASALVATVASAAGPAALAPLTPLTPVLEVTPDVPQAALDAGLSGRVTLQVRVSRDGLVDSVRVTSGDPRLREAAIAAARWTVYAPQPAPAWTALAYTLNGAVEAEPLNPDVLTMAREAEAAKDWNNALAAWTGALARLGTHPALANVWSLREHSVRVAAHAGAAAHPGGETTSLAQTARGEQERAVASGKHADLVAIWDRVLKEAPWWGDIYLWRAGSLAACGRSAEARRSLRFYQLCPNDSSGRWLAGTALRMLAAGDSLGACELIKKRAQTFNADPAE